MSDDLNLNSLKRFRKQTDHYVLEEHGSCEVPAGCGGVVLRWRSPDTGVYVRFQTWVTGAKSKLWLDGAELRGSHSELTTTEHVLGIEMTECQIDEMALMLSITPQVSIERPAHVQKVQPTVVSQQPEAWKWTLTPPGEGWAAIDFPDETWQPMSFKKVTPPEESDWRSYSYNHCLQQGASPIGVEGCDSNPKQIWVRFRFQVHSPGDS